MSKRETGQNQRDVKRLLEQAVAHHQAGRLQEAEWGYQAVLKMQPGHIDAQHNLGVVAMQGNRPQQALPHLKSALEGRPDIGQYWLSYIAALMQAGQPEMARQILAQGRQRGLQGAEADRLEQTIHRGFGSPKPDRTDLEARFASGSFPECVRLAESYLKLDAEDGRIWEILGISLWHGRQPAEALAALETAAGLLSDKAELRYNLGLLCKQMGLVEKAERYYREAIDLQPELAPACNNLATLLLTQSRLTEAEFLLRKVAHLRADQPEACRNLGAVLMQKKDYSEAEHWLKKALALRPGDVTILDELARLYWAQERWSDAIAHVREKLHWVPESIDALIQLGTLLQYESKPREAETEFRRVLEMDASNAKALLGLSASLFAQEHYRDAVDVAGSLSRLHPGMPEGYYNQGIALVETGDVEQALGCLNQALSIAPNSSESYDNLLFTLNYHPDKGEEEIYEAYREYDKRYGEPQKENWKPHLNNRESGRRLKVGYVSPDFNTHAVGKFLEPLLSGHNKAEVEIYGYAELRREDEATERYKRYVDHWIPTRGLSHDELAERIRQDGIDILVDVAGHTSRNRLQVFAKKPAPVSVSWLGFGYTTGLKAIDYFLTDGTSVPEGTEHLYAEKPWRLEGSAYVYRPAAGMGEVSPLPALEQGHITFGTLTRAVRINHRVIRVWSEILKRVAGSKLVIDSANYQDGKLCEELVEKFAAEGIEPERLDIGYHSPPWDVLRGMDIGLDCFPHNSGTTLFESLYMGIPYVTLAGRTSPRRLGSSILKGVGHPEWITETEAAYIEKVVDLAGDKERLAAIRGRLREEMEAGPLRDEAGFVQRVEQAYRHMFQAWSVSEK